MSTKTAAAILAERKHKTIQYMMSDPESSISRMKLTWDNVVGIRYLRKDRSLVIELMTDSLLIECKQPLLELQEGSEE